MISIITPYYNSRNYIEKLIQSLEKQTDKDFEWIIINDFSKNEEKNFLKEKLSELRINYIYLENIQNEGVGRSRNKGIENANGDYIVFVDSDDYISVDFIENIKEILVKEEPEVLFFDYYRVKKKKLIYCNILKKIDDRAVSKKEALIYMKGNVCGKVIKKEIVISNKLRFSTLKRFEDWLFMVELLTKVNKIIYLKKGLYYYYINSTSVTQINKESALLYSIQAFKILKNKLEKKEEYLDMIKIFYMREVIYISIKEYLLGREKDILKINWQDILEYKNILIKYSGAFDFHQKIMLWIYLKRCFYIFRIIMLIMSKYKRK